jgi:FHA domain
VSDHPTWCFRAGEWFGIFGAHATVVLPPSEKARVAPLWELVDDGAGFDETLDALISGGLRDLPGFVLVSSVGDETRVVLRGAARAHLATTDEVVHVEGDGATTWVERTLTGVTRVRIEVADETAPDDLAVAGGLVRLATAECPAAPARLEVPVPVSEPAPHPDDGPLTEAMPGLPPTPPPARSATPSEADHDGLTRSGDPDSAREALARPGIPGQPPAPPVTARPVARLVFSGGEDVEVDRLVLVGRAPEPRRHTLTEEPRLVTVRSPHHEISSTHLEIRPGSGADHGAAVVTDLGSTNGTLLLQPGLPPEALQAGVAVQLIPGAVIDLGDGVSIQVVNP